MHTVYLRPSLYDEVSPKPKPLIVGVLQIVIVLLRVLMHWPNLTHVADDTDMGQVVPQC